MSRTLWVASCIHAGANEHDEKELDKYIKAAISGHWDIALIGDMVNMGTCFGTKHLSSIWEDNLKPQGQVDYINRKFKPVRRQIKAILRGNHDDRAYNVTGLQIGKMIADVLGAPYYDAIKLLKWNGFNIFLAHGTSGSSFGDFSKIIQTYDNLDAIVLGHTHEWLYKVVRKYKSGGKSDLIHCARAGSFLDYSTYAKKALYQPTPLGSVLLKAHDEGLEVKYGLASI